MKTMQIDSNDQELLNNSDGYVIRNNNFEQDEHS